MTAVRALLLTAALAAGLSACNRDREPASGEAPVAPGAPATADYHLCGGARALRR